MNPKPTVLVLASTYPRWKGDPEPGFVHELSKRLTSEFDVVVLCPHAKGAKKSEMLEGVYVHRFRYGPESLETLVNDGGILSNLKKKPIKFFLLLPFLLSNFFVAIKLIKSYKPVVIHAHWIIPQGFLLAFLSLFIRLPPVLLTSHGGDLYGLNSKWMLWLKSWIIRKASVISVVSNAMVKKVNAMGINNKKINVLPMGIDFDNVFFADAAVVRTPYKILFVGRLVEKKGVIHLIKAFAEIKLKIPASQLAIVGSGPEEQVIYGEVESLGLKESVTFKGSLSQKDLPKLFREASVFVAPFVVAESGDQEGFGLVSIEAIGCGCPCILGGVDAVRDFYSEFQDSPIILDPRDTDQLIEAISKVINNPELFIAKTLRLRTSLYEQLNWTVVASKYRGLLSACTESTENQID